LSSESRNVFLVQHVFLFVKRLWGHLIPPFDMTPLKSCMNALNAKSMLCKGITGTVYRTVTQ